MFIYFLLGYSRSSLLPVSFLYFQGDKATLCCGLQASHCSGVPCCRAQALGVGFSFRSVWAQ